jgi:hypothetical protein
MHMSDVKATDLKPHPHDAENQQEMKAWLTSLDTLHTMSTRPSI